jgi:nitrite reductase (NADH) large subunit
MTARTRIVVVGNGMVGQRFLEKLPALESFDITVIGEEPRPAYDRVQLSSFFAGKTAEDLNLVPPGFFETCGIATRLGERAVAIDRSARIVLTSAGDGIAYDKLILATGSQPFVPPVPGRDRSGCYVYRTIEDLEAIRAGATQARVGVVIGGGLLGLEAARALRDLGLETHVVELAPRLMALQVDDGGGAMLRRKIEALGVRVHTGKSTSAIKDDAADRDVSVRPDPPAGHNVLADHRPRRAHCVAFADGSELQADIIVFSAGIRPRDELARQCQVTVGQRGGIVIDDFCRTSDPDIYAIGECALWQGRIFGLVAPGYQMAEIAARHLAGESAAAFTGADMSTKLKLLGVDVASIGDAHAATPGARSYAFVDERREIYKRLIVDADCRRLLGAVLVGDAAEYGTLLQTMLHGMPLPEHPEDLILPARGSGGAAAGSGLAALPEAAQICSCNNVTKGAICAAVEGGCTTVGAIKASTRAASTCGGCAPLVKQILDAELRRRGVALENHLCEHFRHSRQQLFHLIRVGGLKSFEDVLSKHGVCESRMHADGDATERLSKPLGCDICKPAIASILASCWNEFVLARDRAPLQDTNDYFLANMQKDGTYSVVPRIPGGEVTPEKLIAIGEVARKFGLYTKITGGQRIDLFGARVHELPLIWADLIAAGFESGHAYGKSLRTVKSCVGSTWCRYGVQDSVGLAIELENRYKGLRSPHKLKLGVSGCTRECAEAQGKDVGVIATEKGWNLYVCGNGGMKPRHAELLAADLDKPTLIRFIDRFLMFYVRTADRLQRTSTWRDNLEGGLEYLQQVVCRDSLGIGAELEADMARVIAGYECEWKKAVEDPATRRRFRHFVNSDAGDSNVVFVRERSQIRPATTAERRTLREAAG